MSEKHHILADTAQFWGRYSQGLRAVCALSTIYLDNYKRYKMVGYRDLNLSLLLLISHSFLFEGIR